MRELLYGLQAAWNEAVQWEKDNYDQDGYDKWSDYR